MIFDGMQVVAELHTDRIDDALAGIAKIINLKPYGQHLLVFTHEALKLKESGESDVSDDSHRGAQRRTAPAGPRRGAHSVLPTRREVR